MTVQPKPLRLFEHRQRPAPSLGLSFAAFASCAVLDALRHRLELPMSPAHSTGATTPSTTGPPARLPSRPREDASRKNESALGVFALVLAFRIVNSLTLRTLFVPDEHYQSLEPAWQAAFGPASGAWITWEWRTQLRSSLNPELFAAIYLAASKFAVLGGLSLPARAELLIAAPKVTQAVFAALLDWYTWKIAEKAFGRRSRTAFTTLALSICSPWQWFCSTRTLSNCLETTFTSIAVYYWPWEYPRVVRNEKEQDPSRREIASNEGLGPLSNIRLSLLLAAFACIFRPTNGLIWLAISLPTLWEISTRQRYILIREILLCGSAVVAIAAISDRLYYQVWTFPPARFLYFNIAQSLAVFYGTNRLDYYFTEGLPLLLTTAVPAVIAGVARVLLHTYPRFDRNAEHDQAGQVSNPPAAAAATHTASLEEVVTRRILTRLTWTSIFVTVALSLISHKEVRFLYPVLPFLHIIGSEPLARFFLKPPSSRSNSSSNSSSNVPHHHNQTSTLLSLLQRRLILSSLLLANLAIAYFASQVHQRGVIDVLSHLRHKHEARLRVHSHPPSTIEPQTTVAFLMPCHSTPWRSHLIYPSPSLSAWALTCEPPLHVPLSERSTYLDEADVFYLDPRQWLESNMQSLDTIPPSTKPSGSGGGRHEGARSGSRSGRYWADILDEPVIRKRPHPKAPNADPGAVKEKRAWPQNLVFFAQLEPDLRAFLGEDGKGYRECWRGFNSYFHDDWRRVGDVVVWCLD